MSYKKHVDLNSDVTVALGGKDAKGKPNPTSVEGYYLGSRTVDGEYGEAKIHYFNTAEGVVGVWGKTNLNRILDPKYLGMMVLVSFTGMGKAQKGKKPPYNYELQYDDGNTTDVSGFNLDAAGAEEPDYSDSEEGYEESSVDGDETEADEPPPARVTAPKTPLKTPTAKTTKSVQDLLASRRSAS